MDSIIKNTGVIFILFLMSCGNGINKKPNKEISKTRNEIVNDITGNYVSDFYNQRNEGYDWVAVSVSQKNNEEIFVSVRSRADKKKPTCTFDTKAYKTNDSIYYSVAEGKTILFSFTSSGLQIKTENKNDEAALYFFCSGGATIAGTYLKITEPIDTLQIDKTSFSKILRLQNIGFNISSKPKGKLEEIEIFPFGASLENQTVFLTIEGFINDAEVEDLNSDGFPEVLVYTQNTENKMGNVIGFSINKGKSMSPISFPSISENNLLRNGYMGFDEFTIVETSLVQRFPIFEDGEKTGKVRQIQYKLEATENSRKFVIVNATEY